MWGSLSPIELVGGLLLSAIIGLLSYRRQALSTSGLVGALITGSLIFGVGGWEWGILLITFFLSSSALSFYRAQEKQHIAGLAAQSAREQSWGKIIW